MRRLKYYKTDLTYCCFDYAFLSFYDVLSAELLSKWISLQKELDIVHPMILYNISDTGITHEIKCAFFIESFEPIGEIIGLYDSFFPTLISDDRNYKLIMFIDAIISKFGKDIFDREYSANKDRFLQILTNTRHRIMHIKRKQQSGKFLSGDESVLYLVKLCHLYRVVLLSLLSVDYSSYKAAVIQSVEYWNEWNGVQAQFLKSLMKKYP